jgi:hypothetical protein
MTIDELEAEGGAAWRQYARLRDAANHSMPGAPAHLAWAEAHAVITDLASDEGFERFAREAQAAEAAAGACAGGGGGSGGW